MKQLEYVAFIIHIADGVQLVINAVHVILLPIGPDVPSMCPAVRIQHSEIAVKAAVFLKHKQYMVDRRNASGAAHRDGS